MKAVMLSLHPQWCEKIFDREKTIEVRKTVPKLETPFKVYVYCTKGKPYLYKNPNSGELFLDNNDGYHGGDYEDRYLTGKVIGSFVCDFIEECIPDFNPYSEEFFNYFFESGNDCLTSKKINKYGEGRNLYGWHITDPKLFDKPRGLSEFRKPFPFSKHCFNCEINENRATKGFNTEYCSACSCFKDHLTRPPQSWCYVEEEK